MTEQAEQTGEAIDAADAPTRRTLLRLGAVAIPAMATMSPAYATAAVSTLKCQIPVPDSANQSKWVKADGTLVASSTSGSFPPPASTYTGDQILTLTRPTSLRYYGNVKDLQNNSYVSQDAFNAHVEYIKKLTRGTAGFSCYASRRGPALSRPAGGGMVRSALARDCVVRPADDLFLLYHRPSGETHVVAAEMMAILAALDDAPGEAEAVVERLARDYDLETEGGDSALEIVTARIAELSTLGLIDRGPMTPARWAERTVRVGPIRLPAPIARRLGHRRRRPAVSRLSGGGGDGVADYTVAVAPPSPLRRWIKPNLDLLCDVEIPGMAQQPVAHGPLALEMSMNLQLAAGMHRFLLLHAGAVERDGGALLMTGESGAGKSTLSAVLAWSGWRLLGDEFAMIDPDSGAVHAHPRPMSLKNESAGLLAEIAPADRFGPVFDGTFKGAIRHLLPPVEAIRRMDEVAAPRLILLPEFAAGAPPEAHRLGVAETFVRLTQASTNYRALGEAGFLAIAQLALTPAYVVRYGSSADALALIEELWRGG